MSALLVLRILVVIGAVCLIFAASIAFAGPICGEASWYGTESGSRTASGALFRPDGMTAAIPSRAMLGKHVRVTDMRTGRSVTVLVNDVGPASRLHRIIDLSRGAARRLGIVGRGTAAVCIETSE